MNEREDAAAVEVDTVIVGAGFGGLAMGIRLSRRGDDFVVLERGDDVGGTWRDNVYPGVACDIPSHLYSFSFAPKHDWSRFFAPGSEIQDYLRDTASEIADRIRLGTDVLDMRWDADDDRWLVTTSTGYYSCRTLVVAAGRLSEPRMPRLSGLDTFTGAAFHSARWDDSVDLAGKRVGVVGTGASAVQLVPRLADTAASVVVFQRSAAYVVPRPDREYSAAEIARFERDPAELRRTRERLFWKAEEGFAQRIGVPAAIDGLRDSALAHRTAQVADPKLRAALTPDYEIGCKRVLLSDDFYPALERDSVTLEASALEAVDGGRVTAASGAEYDLDVLVFATGFVSTRPPFAERVVGRGGIRLSDAWSDGMVAFASTTVHGFPNLFVIDGPNASLGHNSAIVMIEAQVEYILGALDASAGATLEVTAEAQAGYVDGLDARSANTVWLEGGCDSWYVDAESRRLTLLWPDFAFAFRDSLAEFDPAPYRITSLNTVSI
ncbi:cation diffusion facilitator CzcD-associated flavoprotein CzcO [Conyzicola lurida]|uniref:Cation diffusion facilitator CzcD-associated flavoprotein CzcO n=1 Tax=Conyzicola lurida TaxID=1172621 RepID=A0A841ASG9_9MICO|nr:cation diffusion facilitator CzcD-associated flavoprotein CzcO [Conyzicola lurida]